MHRFLVGTCSLHDPNELNILQYSEDSNHFEIACIFTHPDQIWAIESSPKDLSLVITSRQSKDNYKSLTLWKMPKQTIEEMANVEEVHHNNYNNDPLDLIEISTFNQNQKTTTIKDIKWHSLGSSLLSVDNKMLSSWIINEGKVTVNIIYIIYVYYI